jgi:glycosyltransferase involved in cell wall biosynthesis
LPYETENYNLIKKVSNQVKVCHSPTNRYYKGSEDIIKICRELEQENIIEFLLIEGKSQDEVVKMKKECDIYIDQIHNRGGWGYGMSSVEALSMGLICMTELVEEYRKFIPDHPFIAIDKGNLKQKIIQLTQNKEMLLHKKKEGKKWVAKYHGIKNVTKALYTHYENFLWNK